MLTIFLSGCGSGGYVGQGITGISTSSFTIDSTQSYAVTVSAGGSLPIAWSLTGDSCSGSTCGTLSSTTGATVTYTAPTVASQLKVNLTATVAGTTSSSTASITVNPLPTLTGVLPTATVGVPYSATLTASGGTGPLTLSVASGTLPAGLTFNPATGVISGTPTVVGTSSFVIQIKDSSIVPATVPTTETIGVTEAPPTPLTVVSGNPPAGTVGTAYTTTLLATGGTAPYTWNVLSGALPGGVTLAPATGTISGTPAAAGTFTFTAQVKDATGALASSTFTIHVYTTLTITTTTLPIGDIGVPYTGTIGAAGGVPPYTCVITGTLPAGLTANGCTVSGTPTASGDFPLSVTVTDSNTPPTSVTSSVTLTIQPYPSLSFTGTLPNAIVNLPYSQTLAATGGVTPYTYAITAGSLPDGLSLSPDGVISGTPTTVGASVFTVTVTDGESPAKTKDLQFTLLVTYAPTPDDAKLKGPYAYVFQGYDDVVLGLLAYQTASVASFTADGTGVISKGELDENHQGSNPTGTTVDTNTFLGSYTIGDDNRGMITITRFNPDGSVGTTTTYAIALKAPVSPATISTQGSLIQFDNNSLQGTKGSGTLLAQTPDDFAAGLSGNYAFGIEGDTPCLPTCTIGIIAGPVASVGQFTAASGTLTSGTSDANVATTNYASKALTGTYGSPDANGRVQLSMSTADTTAGVYPTDYAVYMVDATHAFLVSTDKHSSYILLAGTAEKQTSTFSNASMSGPFIGYENALPNPGLLGAVLKNTLNLSTATIFRATADSTGTCNTTNVDMGGITSLVNGLTGLGSGSDLLNALLGTYQSTGNSACTVASNGRGVLNYPAPSGLLANLLSLLGLGGDPPSPRVVYLSAPNHGYFLETGYAGLGNIEAQTGAPFSLATINGSYVSSNVPSSSVASINSSGEFTANGAGSASITQDLNVGVGTINILQLGTTSTQTYTLTDATQGRYTYGGTQVIYAISPDRFVMVDTNVLTTSPSVTLLY